MSPAPTTRSSIIITLLLLSNINISTVRYISRPGLPGTKTFTVKNTGEAFNSALSQTAVTSAFSRTENETSRQKESQPRRWRCDLHNQQLGQGKRKRKRKTPYARARAHTLHEIEEFRQLEALGGGTSPTGIRCHFPFVYRSHYPFGIIRRAKE
jgi:hypothetical protein